MPTNIASSVEIDIPEDVREELEDPRFLTRQHYSRATYAVGCHGTLCRLAETHRGRERNKERALAEGRNYRPRKRETDREEELAPIIAWHLWSRGSGAQSE